MQAAAPERLLRPNRGIITTPSSTAGSSPTPAPMSTSNGRCNPDTPHGAWEFHEHIIPNSPAKPIRIWMEVGDRDNFNSNALRDNMHGLV